MLNAYAEQKAGKMRAVKRPALVATFAALEGGAGSAGGMFAFSQPDGSQTLVGIQNDVLNNSPTPTATTLRFFVQPADWKIATAMSPSVVVKAYDSFGNVMSSYGGTVTIAFSANPNGGTLSGTLSVAAVSGVATFSNLKIDKVGGGYKLQATASLMKAATSTVFKIVSSLAFTVQPANNPPNTTFDTPVEVSAVDSSSATIAGYTGDITLAIGANPSSGTLSGTLTRTAVAGVASFTDLSIDQLGDGYTLIASETNAGMSSVTSNSFNISNSYTLVAGSAGAQRGYKQDTGLGSLTPNTLNGDTVIFLESKTTATTNTALWTLGVQPQSFFTSITIGGTTLTTATATYVASGGSGNPGSTWTWTGTVLIPASGTYSVTFT